MLVLHLLDKLAKHLSWLKEKWEREWLTTASSDSQELDLATLPYTLIPNSDENEKRISRGYVPEFQDRFKS